MKKEDKDFLILEIAKSNLIKKGGYIYSGDLKEFIDQLEEPEQCIDAAHDLLQEITTLLQEDFDLYWNCINDGIAVSDLKQEKVVIPQFMADFITEIKPNFNIRTVFTLKNNKHEQGQEWALDNPDVFARAWLDGYTVEKEKLYLVKVDQGTNYLYVESLHLYSDVIKPLDFNYKFSPKEYALKFTSRNQAKGVAELVGGEVEDVTD